MTDDTPSFQYDDLWYIQLADYDSKFPRDEWGGYGQSYVASDDVFSHNEVANSDWDHWGVVGTQDFEHASLSTLVLDLDVHKAPDDFDLDRVDMPADTLVVRSQNGGYHVYFQVHEQRGELQESDFQMTADPGWDIDIRGSAVSMHVVAPADIPGVDSPYEVVNDEEIRTVIDPADAAERIRLDEEPLLEYNPGSRVGSDIDIDRDVEPPAEMPTCYHRGLQLRAQAPEDHPNTHKVNVLTALCGLAAGYDVDTMVEHFVDDYPPGEDADRDKTEYQLKHLAGHAEAGSYSPPAISTLRDFGILDEEESCTCNIEYHGRASEPESVDWSEVKRGKALLKSQTAPDEPYGELEERNGCYGYEWFKTDEDGNVIDSGFDRVTNFTLELQSRINTYEGEILSVQVNPESPLEDEYEVYIAPAVFNEARQLREEIVTGRTTHFNPQGRQTQQVLNDLRQTVSRQPAPVRNGTEFIGLHGDDYDEWVTPNGTLTTDGWADDAEHVFYDKGGDSDSDLESSSVSNKWDLDPETAEYDQEEIAELLELVPWTRQPSRGLPILGWFYATPVKPLIHDEEDEFNLLQVAGSTGTGKTTTLEMFYQLFGAASSPFGCDNTRFTIEKRLAGSCGFPIWLDEYKPTDLDDRHVQWLHQKFREVSRGATTSKGRPSLGEVAFHFRAPVVFSGEQTVSKPAVRRRTIITQLSTAGTEIDYERAHKRVVGGSYKDEDGETHDATGYDLRSHALAYFQHVLEMDPDKIRSLWTEAREKRDELIDLGSLETSEKQGLQTVVFGWLMYRDFAEAMGTDLAALPGDKELRDALDHVMSNIGPGGRRREHIDDFTELLAQAANTEYIERGKHYKIVNSRKYETENALAFHMPSCFPAVKKFMREYNVEGEYSFLAKTDYVDNFGDKADDPSSYALATSHRVNGMERGSKAILIDGDLASDQLGSEFTIGAFIDDPEDQGEGTSSDDDDDDGSHPEHPDSVPIGEIDPSQQDIASVIGTIEFGKFDGRDTSEKGPAWTATISDATGEAELVAWDEEDIPAFYDDYGAFTADALHIKGAQTGEYDGDLQLVIGETTHVEKAQVGAGATTAEETDDDQAGLEDAPDADDSDQEADAAADGGQTTTDDDDGLESLKPRVVQTVRDLQEDQPGGADREDVVDAFADTEAGDDAVRSAIESALKDGRLTEAGGGKLRKI